MAAFSSSVGLIGKESVDRTVILLAFQHSEKALAEEYQDHGQTAQRYIAAVSGRAKPNMVHCHDLFGDMVLPRGGSIGLPTLLSLFHAMDVGSGTVRTALSRLSADGWVERTRIGRNAYYCLSSRGTALSRDAEPRIYGTFSFKTQRKLRLAVASASVRSLVGDEAALVATRMRKLDIQHLPLGHGLGWMTVLCLMASSVLT